MAITTNQAAFLRSLRESDRNAGIHPDPVEILADFPETLDGLSEAEIESVYYESESGCEWGHTFRPCPHDDPNDSDEIENESESE